MRGGGVALPSIIGALLIFFHGQYSTILYGTAQSRTALLELTEVDMRRAYRMSLMISFVQKLKG